MKRKILVTAIIVFLSAMTLIHIEPAGITAEDRTGSGGPAMVASPPPLPAAAPADIAAYPQTEIKHLSERAATVPAAPAKTDRREPAAVDVQTESATSAPTAPPSMEAQEPVPAQPAAAVVPTAAQQEEMLGYINVARAQINLAPLVLDARLCSGAELKSQDLAVKGYFSHTSPTYGSPFDMMRGLGVTYRIAGENIARNRSVITAHNAFMNSSGHRANVLNPAFGKVGLGFYQKGNDLFVTQWFTN